MNRKLLGTRKVEGRRWRRTKTRKRKRERREREGAQYEKAFFLGEGEGRRGGQHNLPIFTISYFRVPLYRGTPYDISP